MKKIAVFNHKGGVSKTTTTFNLGWKLARVGKLGSAKLLIEAGTDDEKDVIISQTLKDTLYKFSFESEQTIEKAMSYIGVKRIWSNLTAPMGMTMEDVKRQLSIIIRRRNNIAHQSDISNLSTMDKDLIDRKDVEFVINFIEKIVRSNDGIVTNQNT